MTRVFLFFCILSLFGCNLPRANRPSVLVIAVEGLGFGTFGCDSDEMADPQFSGVRAFCQEAIHFSHAFTPSTMSQPTLTSLLTGLYPFDHGVRDNGRNFLSAQFQTLGEVALAKGYRTLFVSGGAPIWRKSGLSQGFEVFDDSVEPTLTNYYRPASDVFRIAEGWLDQVSDRDSSLAVMYLADLQFPETPTYNDEGEMREKSEAGQIAEVAESLSHFVHWLKSSHKWNSSNIVLVGLNSAADNLRPEADAIDLHSENTQVTLFIKPAQKEGRSLVPWADDRNVSLVDVGKTMFEWLGDNPPPCSVPELEPESLVHSLAAPESKWNENRLIVTESAWPDWLEGSGIRWSIRQGPFLYIHDVKPLIYNTLTDRMERAPLSETDPLWMSLNRDVLNLTAKINMTPWRGLQPHWFRQIQVARELWQHGLMNRHPRGFEPWAKWYLERDLQLGNWPEVKRLASVAGDTVGTYVAGLHLGEHLPLPHFACLRLLLSKRANKRVYRSECDDELILTMRVWQAAKSEDEKTIAQERFTRLFSQLMMDRQIARFNYMNGLRWDVDRTLPEGPQMADYVLTLKQFEPLLKRVSALRPNKY